MSVFTVYMCMCVCGCIICQGSLCICVCVCVFMYVYYVYNMSRFTAPYTICDTDSKIMWAWSKFRARKISFFPRPWHHCRASSATVCLCVYMCVRYIICPCSLCICVCVCVGV